MTEDSSNSQTKKRSTKKKALLYTAAVAAGLLFLAGGTYGYLYASSPEHIRKPAFQHYHFRTQIVADGTPVDFSRDEFQQAYNSTACSAEVGGTPIDFHDNVDQMTHVHWDGMTGGEFLKYYGWNFIGGNSDVLGRRYDAGLMPLPVNIYGKLLPALPENAKFYVYVGDADGYQQKSWDDFLAQDLEVFFGKQSNIGGDEQVSSSGVLDWLFPKASAHGGVADDHQSDKSEEELQRINNLIGNVVIFAQENEPTKEQIKARFGALVPLSESTCGG